MPLDFCARARECAELLAAFEAVSLGAGPRAVEVRGPSGSGKSRLVAELYGRIAANAAHNPPEAAYWPTEIPLGPTSRATGPELRKAPAARGAARFLWLGLRATERLARLTPERGTQQDELVREIELHARRGQRFGGLGESLALALAREGEMDSGPRERALAALRAALTSSACTATVLWIDDAQWASDELLELAAVLWREARARRAALLVILCDDGDEPVRATRAEFSTLVAAQRVELAPVPAPEFAAALDALLPGALPRQREALLASVGGNFLELEERIAWLSLSRGNFEHGDRALRLSAAGEAELAQWPEGRRLRLELRISQLASAVERLLGWSSANALEFLGTVALEFGRRCALRGTAERDLVARAAPLAQLPSDARVEHGRSALAFHLEAQKLWRRFGERESELLSQTLRDELARWINASFGDDGNWRPHDTSDPATLPPESVLALLAQERTAELRDLLDMAMAELSLDAAPDWSDPRQVASLRAIRVAVQNDAEEQIWARTRRCSARLEHVEWSLVPEGVLGSAGREALARRISAAGLPRLALAIRASRVELLRARGDALRDSESGIDEFADALSDLGQSLWELGENPGAERAFGEQLALMRARVAGDTAPLRRRNLSIALDNVAGLAATRGQLEFAREVYVESLAIARELASDDDSPGARRDLFLSLSNLATINYRRGRLEEALSMHEESLAIRRELAEALESDDARHDLENGLECVADIEHELGRFEAAAQKYEECLTIERELAERLGTSAHRWSVAQLLRSIADIERNSGRRGAALRRLEEAIAIARGLVAELGTPASRRELAASLRALGTLQEERNELERARATYTEALELARDSRGESEDSTAGRASHAHLLCDVADIDLARGDLEGARRGYEQALAIHRQLATDVGTPDCRRDLLVVLDHLANLDERQGLTDSALTRFREIADSMRALAAELGTPAARRDHSVAILRVADALRARGRPQAALELYEQCLALRLESLERLEDSADANLSFVTDWHATLRIVRDLARECGELERARELALELVEMAWPDDDEDEPDDFGPAEQEELLAELVALAAIELDRDAPEADDVVARACDLAALVEAAFDDPEVDRQAEALDAATLERCASAFDARARLAERRSLPQDAATARTHAATLRERARNLPT
ncbi:MAG: tetratricopeptide repeat protein [Planctomycetes bacterium]|nr:tetratricopeptide repeat protein [Planctomycetota bacterium]